MYAKVTEFAYLLHYEFVGTTRDPASLSNRLLPAEAGKNNCIFYLGHQMVRLQHWRPFERLWLAGAFDLHQREQRTSFGPWQILEVLSLSINQLPEEITS